jgi:zinc protease
MQTNSLFHSNLLSYELIKPVEISQAKRRESLQVEQLPNGLNIYFENREEPLSKSKTFTVRLAVKAGYNVEDLDLHESGIAHLLEHCLFLGTKNFNQETMKTFLLSCGISMIADSNASTSFDLTNYHFNRIPPEHIKTLLTLVFEMAFYATFPEDLVYKEKNAVIEEMLKATAPERLLYNHVGKIRTEGCSLSKRYEQDMAKLSDKIETCQPAELRQMIQKFYEKWYTPDKMGLFIIGDAGNSIEAQKLFEYTKELFSQIPPIQTPLPLPSFPLYVPDNVHFSSFNHTSLNPSCFIQIHQKDKAIARSSVSEPIELTMKRAVKDVSRIYFLLLLHFRLFPEIYKSDSVLDGFELPFYTQEREGHYYYAITLTSRDKKNPDSLAKIFKLFLQQLKSAKALGFTKEEFDRSRESVMKYFNRVKEYNQQLSHFQVAASYETNFKQGALCFDQLSFIKFYQIIWEKLTLEELHVYTKKFLDIFNPLKAKRTLVFGIHPQPLLPTHLKSLGEVYQTVLRDFQPEPFKVAPINLDWLPKDLSPTFISPPQPILEQSFAVDNEQKNVLIAEKISLANGMTAWFRETPDQQSGIQGKLFLKTDSVHITPQDKRALKFAIAALNRMGFGPYALSDIQPYLLSKRVTLSFELTAQNIIVHLNACSSEVEDLTLAFQLLYSRLQTLADKIHTPDFENQWEIVKKNEIESYEHALTLPQTKFNEAYSRLLWGEHPYYAPFSSEEWNSVTLEQSQQIILSMLNNLEKSHFVLVGNISKDSVLPLLSTYIGHLSSFSCPRSAYQWPALVPDFQTSSKEIYENNVQNQTHVLIVYLIDKTNQAFQFIPKEKVEFAFNVASSILNYYLNDKLRMDNQMVYSVSTCLINNSLNSNYYELHIQLKNPTAKSKEIVKETFFAIENMGNEKEKLRKNLELHQSQLVKNIQQQGDKTSYWQRQISYCISKERSLNEIIIKENWLKELNVEELLPVLKAITENMVTCKTLFMHPKGNA